MENFSNRSWELELVWCVKGEVAKRGGGCERMGSAGAVLKVVTSRIEEREEKEEATEGD